MLSLSPVERILQPLLAALGGGARRLSPGGIVTNIERRLTISGSTARLERVLVLKLVLGGAFLGAGVAYALAVPSTMSFVMAVTAGVAGYLAPDVVLARKATARQLAIRQQAPGHLGPAHHLRRGRARFDAS